MTSARGPVVARGLALAARVESYAADNGYAEQARRMRMMRRRWQDGQVRIVVAGMQKRGKSSLINALLNRPGLVPVDEDVSTDSHIAIVHGMPSRASVHREGNPPFEIPLDELRDYASVKGDPAKRAGVLGVEVAFPHTMLKGVRLIDTPGVDSLTLGHRHATMQVLRTADVMVFTVSGQDQPLLRHELEFLVAAAAHVHRIAFVLTKIDNAPRWGDLLEANQERLAAHLEAPVRGEPAAPEIRERLLRAPWLPISARQAEAAAARAATGDEERSARLLERSRMHSLVEFVRECAEQREAVRIGPLLDGIAGALSAIVGTEEDRFAAATEDDETLRRNQTQAREAAERMNRRLAERRRRGTRISFLGSDVDQLVRRRIDGLKREYLDHIAAADLTTAARVDAYASTLPESLSRSLDALWQELLTEVQDVVAESLQEFARSLDVAAVDVALERNERQMVHPTDAPAVRGARFDAVGDGVPMITLTYSLAMIGAMVNPVGVVVGPALAVALMWRRQQNKTKAQGQADLKGFVTSVLNQARGELSSALAKQVSQKRTEVEIAVDAELTRQKKDIQARVEQANRLQNADVATRKQAAAEAGGRLKALHALGGELSEVRGALAGNP